MPMVVMTAEAEEVEVSTEKEVAEDMEEEIYTEEGKTCLSRLWRT